MVSRPGKLALLLLLFFATAASAQTWTLTTAAGSTEGGGYVDDVANDARFSSPYSVIADHNGNLYVADRGNHVIRRISPSLAVTTLAGKAGTPGSADGTGNAARFNFPAGMAIDPVSGTLYVADSWNHTIRKITPAGVVTTVAGKAGLSGSVDGDGSAARFNFPQGVAVDATGLIWVADTNNNKIRRIAGSFATVTTIAGANTPGFEDGTGNSARFTAPYDLAPDANGNLWIADTGNSEIRRMTPSGVVTTVAGVPFETGRQDGVGTNARFWEPRGIDVLPNGTILVVDSRNSQIRKVTTAGVVTTVAANGFGSPLGIGSDTAGNAYIADRNAQVIFKLSPAFAVTILAGSRPVDGVADGSGTNARFRYPQAVAADRDGNLWVSDLAETVRKINVTTGTVTRMAGLPDNDGTQDGLGNSARFEYPAGMAIDGNGNLFIADTDAQTIRRMTPAGQVTTMAGAPRQAGKTDASGAAARFRDPWGLAFDGSGNLFIADSGNHIIRMMTPGGTVTTYAGSGNAGSSDGSAQSARFDTPRGLAVDASGNLYVTDSVNHNIRKITKTGTVTTLAGSAGISGAEDGTGSNAHFNQPFGVAVDGPGNVYVADTGNHTVRKVTPSGVVTTILGRFGNTANVDGTASAAGMFYPQGLAFDGQGRLIIADTANHNVRIASLPAPKINAFTANPQTVTKGGSSILTWSTTDATTVSISPDIGAVSLNGTASVVVQQSTVFTLTATMAGGGTVTAKVTVFVGGGPKPRVVFH